jgi:hypothetical protein
MFRKTLIALGAMMISLTTLGGAVASLPLNAAAPAA